MKWDERCGSQALWGCGDHGLEFKVRRTSIPAGSQDAGRPGRGGGWCPGRKWGGLCSPCLGKVKQGLSFLSKWVAEEATLYKVNSPSIPPEPPGHAQALDVDTGA